MKQAFPDLRNAEPGRAEVDRSNVVIQDLVTALVEIDKAITRFESEADSRFGMLANRRIDALIHVCENLKRRINDTRRMLNSADDTEY